MNKMIKTTLASLMIAAVSAVPAFAAVATDTIVIPGDATNTPAGSILMVDGKTGSVTPVAGDDSAEYNVTLSADRKVDKGNVLLVNSADGSVTESAQKDVVISGTPANTDGNSVKMVDGKTGCVTVVTANK